MIGCLMDAMSATRSAIRLAIGVLSCVNHNLSNERTVALKCVFSYLTNKKDWNSRFGRAFDGDNMFRCQVNSDYAGCPDDCKLTRGLVITFVGAVNGELGRHM